MQVRTALLLRHSALQSRVACARGTHSQGRPPKLGQGHMVEAQYETNQQQTTANRPSQQLRFRSA
jgi:hypothetical protein